MKQVLDLVTKTGGDYIRKAHYVTPLSGPNAFLVVEYTVCDEVRLLRTTLIFP